MKSKQGLVKKPGRGLTTTTVKSATLKRKGVGVVRRAVRTSPKKRLTLQQKSAAQLQKPADEVFSRYIRLRDSTLINGTWMGDCITCTKLLPVYADGKWLKNAQNGHLISRGVLQLRYDEENCNLQCSHCNAWLDKDEMIERYRIAVDYKYGDGVYKSLKARSKAPGALKRLTKQELLQVIEDSKQQIDFYLRET